MSPLRSLNEIPDSTLLLFLELCDPFREKVPGDISQQSWVHISELSRLHGLTPFLYYRTKSLGIELPKQIEKEWVGIYLYQMAAEKKARSQIKELKEILDPEGIPFILLKGASAMLRLYPQPGLRTFCDLDILIPVDKAAEFNQATARAGYKPISARNSPEEEEVMKYDVHLNPFHKGGGFMMEPHLNILGIEGNRLVATPELWQEREEVSTDGFDVNHLNIEHFVIHSSLHITKHLSEEGFAELKWFTDLLCAIKAWKIDWARFWTTARKWSVEKGILPVVTTLNHYWQTQIPLSAPSEPIALDVLVLGKQDREKQFYAKLPASYFKHLLKMRTLPDTESQVRYVFRIFLPTQENLRWRYSLSSKKGILPYYFVHILFLSKRFFKGLWHQLSYHPQ